MRSGQGAQGLMHLRCGKPARMEAASLWAASLTVFFTKSEPLLFQFVTIISHPSAMESCEEAGSLLYDGLLGAGVLLLGPLEAASSPV